MNLTHLHLGRNPLEGLGDRDRGASQLLHAGGGFGSCGRLLGGGRGKLVGCRGKLGGGLRSFRALVAQARNQVLGAVLPGGQSAGQLADLVLARRGNDHRRLAVGELVGDPGQAHDRPQRHPELDESKQGD